ncbi:PLP-dependent aminotransferase family protein [Ahrensia marina]|jgi:DNA-binding transcriptional MocR family regulator|uniref:HTH gntR-type domain-containing protein n=1 Tax=Ahrensia marina TaxID=1514904 RepID=A0A0N0VLA3_9HYPH|nr:PLP-dependent aminotransferase family protein [Ahrensia marina]KPB00174.1 hypothetical protein SU32_15320 [Ahrensia marina]
MTNWLPELSDNKGPLYVRLADAIERDISSGALPAGSKLPPHRNLAFDIGVTVGTVSRAYGVVRERGLVAGEVGRGTYIKSPAADRNFTSNNLSRYNGLLPKAHPELTLMNSTSAPEVGQAKMIARIFTEIAEEDPKAISDYLRHIPDSWREAGRRWVARKNWSPSLANILPTQGSHAALVSVLNTVTGTGDRIAFEELTYPATVRASALMGRRSIKIATTDQGLDPEAFEHVCAQQHPKIAVIVSTFNNPTLTTIPLENRLKIVESARRHNVLILDDDTYGVLDDDAPPLFSELAPERTFHVTSLSKSVAAGLRSGFVVCPTGYATRVMNAHRLITGSAPRAIMEISTRLILSGEADQIMAKVALDNAARVEKVRAALAGFEFRSDPRCPFVWLRLPEPWLPSTFCKAARAQNVVVEEADEFKVGQTEYAVPFVRIGITGELEADRLDDGLNVLKQLLQQPALAYDTIE